jgi:hypothetical protein
MAKPVTFLVFLVCFAACRNPFATRKPEDPSLSASNWISPLYPEQVLVNLQTAVAERNTDNFIRCFADPAYSGRSFRFEPDPQTSSNHPGVFDGWGINRETGVMQQAYSLVPKDSTCMLTWTKILREIIASDTAVMVRQYKLELRHKPSILPVVFEGQAEFRLAADRRGEWCVYQWTDNSLGESVCWTELKAALGG